MIAWIVGVVALVGLGLAGLVLFTAWTAYQVEKKLPPRGRFIDLDGARIHYLDEGTGPTLLLIHGLSGQMHNFTHSLLGKLRQDFRVVILDRPGSGYSTLPANASATIGVQAQIISRFCQEIKLGRPLIVGHSLGGAIALALALNHPEQVAGLALLAPVTHRPEGVPPPFDGIAIASPLLRRLIAWTLATPLSIANRERTLATIFGPEKVPPDFAVRGGGILNLRPCSFIGASAELMATQHELGEMPARYKDLTVPVGILYGSDDRILDPSAQGTALAAKVEGADLELIEGGGHMIPITSANRTAAFIARMAQRAAAAERVVLVPHSTTRNQQSVEPT
ncbi:MAG: alpha/beta hydrolase [Bradyrhizobiaceae bacterium]|nr:alpha/beta hydrolase [Bradyrhizobiaceae bacterium]